MAASRTQILAIFLAIAIALLAALLFPTVILPLLPPLQPFTAQLLLRLRDIFAFLAFTTALAVGIFSTQRKDDAQHTKKTSSFLEHHPLGSIFGEPGPAETEHLGAVDEDAQAVTKRMVTSYGGDAEHFSIDRASSALVNGLLLQKRSARLAMEVAHERNLPILKEEYGTSTEPKVPTRLHRKSSSLDDSVNYEPEVEVVKPIPPESTPPPSTLGKTKSVKRVSFSLTTPPTSSSPAEATKKTGEETAEKKSPGDLTRQADAYIAKVKEQLRMQRLESLQRYRRRVS